MQNRVFSAAVDWLFSVEKGKMFMPKNERLWEVACGSVAIFLDEDKSKVLESMSGLAKAIHGEGWREVWRGLYSDVTLKDALPKKHGGRGIGLRDVTGICEYLERLEKRNFSG